MNYFLYIIFGLGPSIAWLAFYLRKDVHPEPKKMLLKVFFYGMLAALVALLLEVGIFQEFNKLPISLFSITILNVFIGVALVEEVLKFLVVQEKVLTSPEFDEPVDAMIYMITAAMGFAALENLLILWSPMFSYSLMETALLSGFRFIGATFLHVLCSGTVGYFLAISFFGGKRKNSPTIFGAKAPGNKWLTLVGLGVAVALHGFYNFSIMMGEGGQKFILPFIILLGSALFVSFGFRRLKE